MYNIAKNRQQVSIMVIRPASMTQNSFFTSMQSVRCTRCYSPLWKSQFR